MLTLDYNTKCDRLFPPSPAEANLLVCEITLDHSWCSVSSSAALLKMYLLVLLLHQSVHSARQIFHCFLSTSFFGLSQRCCSYSTLGDKFKLRNRHSSQSLTVGLHCISLFFPPSFSSNYSPLLSRCYSSICLFPHVFNELGPTCRFKHLNMNCKHVTDINSCD